MPVLPRPLQKLPGPDSSRRVPRNNESLQPINPLANRTGAMRWSKTGHKARSGGADRGIASMYQPCQSGRVEKVKDVALDWNNNTSGCRNGGVQRVFAPAARWPDFRRTNARETRAGCGTEKSFLPVVYRFACSGSGEALRRRRVTLPRGHRREMQSRATLPESRGGISPGRPNSGSD